MANATDTVEKLLTEQRDAQFEKDLGTVATSDPNLRNAAPNPLDIATLGADRLVENIHASALEHLGRCRDQIEERMQQRTAEGDTIKAAIREHAQNVAADIRMADIMSGSLQNNPARQTIFPINGKARE